MYYQSALVLIAAAVTPVYAANPFTGRWDYTVSARKGNYPGWIQVAGSDANLDVRVQPRSGSAFDVKGAKLDGEHLVVPMDKEGASTLELSIAGNALSGMLKRKGEPPAVVSGVRAPALDRKAPKRWSKPESLFNGRDLSGWEPDKP